MLQVLVADDCSNSYSASLVNVILKQTCLLPCTFLYSLARCNKSLLLLTTNVQEDLYSKTLSYIRPPAQHISCMQMNLLLSSQTSQPYVVCLSNCEAAATLTSNTAAVVTKRSPLFVRQNSCSRGLRLRS